MQTERIVWIDVGKSIGILLVVAAHNPYVYLNHRLLYDFIFSFHVPFLFALSGASLRVSSEFKSVFLRSASLIWVYFFCAVVSIPFVMNRGDAQGQYFSELLKGIVYGTGYTMHPVPLWFLPPLALTVPVSWFLIRRLGGEGEWFFLKGAGVALLLALVGSLAVNYFDYRLVEKFGWGECLSSGCFWSADLLLLSCGYVIFGWVLSYRSASHRGGVVGASLLVCLFLFAFFYVEPRLDMDARRMAPWFGSVLVSFIAIAALFKLCQLFGDRLSLFSVIGGATLPILASHQFIQKKFLLYFFGAFSEVGWWGFVLSVFFAVGAVGLLDQYLMRKNKLWAFVFYPRRLGILKG